MVHDDIVFQNNDSIPIVVGTGARGSFCEQPYTPITRYWSYEANLYQFQNKLMIQLTNSTKIVDIVDGEWESSYSHETQSLISIDGGATWSVTKDVEVGSLQPISSVASQ